MNATDAAPSTLAGSAFIGRARELEALRAALSDAIEGRGSLALVTGEPGIGKTRLADELAREAAAHGVAVHWARCWEGGGAPAYWPWTQVIRSCVVAPSAQALAEALGAAGAELDSLVPEIRPHLGAPAPVAANPEHARFRLLDATAMFLKRAAAGRPLLLVFDDLHAADGDSLLLLRFVAGELRAAPVMIVATYREEAVSATPAAQQLGEMRRDATHLALRGLAADEVAHLIASAVAVGSDTGGMAQSALPPAWVAAVCQVTDGNPLFVEAVARVCLAAGRFDEPHEVVEKYRVPEQVRHAVGRRLAVVGDTAREVLAVAAVIGREFDLTMLKRLLECEDAAPVLDAIGVALRAAIVRRVDGSLGHFAFVHALLREVLYGELPLSRRVALHGRIARALEEQHQTDIDVHVAEIAHHAFAAALDGDIARAVFCAERAAERARVVCAYEEAARHRSRALQAFELRPADLGDLSDSERRRCELLIALAEAQNDAADRGAARETARRALELARRLDLAQPFARAVLAYGGGWAGNFEVARFDAPLEEVFDDTFAGLLEEGLRLLDEGDNTLRARLLSRLAVEHYFSARHEQRDALSRRAVAAARRLGDARTLAHVLLDRHTAIWTTATAPERLELAREIARLGAAAADADLESAGLVCGYNDLLELGETSELEAAAAGVARFAERTRHPSHLWHDRLLGAMQALLTGRYPAGEELAHEALRLGRRAHRPALLVYALQIRALRLEQGRVADLETMAALWHATAERYPHISSARSASAFLFTQIGRPTEARAAFEVLAARGFDLLEEVTWLMSLAELTEVCRALDDAARAAVLYDLMLPYARCNVVGGFAAVCWGSAARSLGILATLLRRWDAAETHFGMAVERNRAMHASPWIAQTQFEHARMLLARAAAGDDTRAQVLLGHAAAAAQGLGMVALTARIAALGLPPTAAPPPTDATRPPAPPAVAPAGGAAPRRVFRKEGEYWSITYGGQPFRLKDLRGLGYIARLLASPGQALHATDLVRLVDPATSEPMPGADEATARPSLGDAGEVLDRQARQEYARRIDDLRAELDEAERFNDSGRAALLQSEIDSVADELRRAVGLGGRARRSGSHAERARVNATRAITQAVKKIRAHHAPLADHLAQCIKTGTFCVYRPDDATPTAWDM